MTKLYRSDGLGLLPVNPSPLSPMQIYSSRDLEDNLNKIREVCSDDKHDWDQRANAVSRVTFSAFPFFSFIKEITFVDAALFI